MFLGLFNTLAEFGFSLEVLLHLGLGKEVLLHLGLGKEVLLHLGLGKRSSTSFKIRKGQTSPSLIVLRTLRCLFKQPLCELWH